VGGFYRLSLRAARIRRKAPDLSASPNDKRIINEVLGHHAELYTAPIAQGSQSRYRRNIEVLVVADSNGSASGLGLPSQPFLLQALAVISWEWRKRVKRLTAPPNHEWHILEEYAGISHKEVRHPSL